MEEQALKDEDSLCNLIFSEYLSKCEGDQYVDMSSENSLTSEDEAWVVPLLVISAVSVTVILVYQVSIVCRASRSHPSRRHLFLSQALLLGLLLGSCLGFVYSLEQTALTCIAIRLGTGLSYVLIYSSLLVKQVFLISLNTGVYLPAMYQALLFSFCVLVQVAIGVQWVVLVPACQYTSSDHILALSYIIFLVVFVSLLALRTKHIRDNYRESSYIFVLMVCKVPLWLSWVVCSLVLPDHLQGAASGQFPLPPLLHLCPGFGLVVCCLVTFLLMFLPRARQLTAMGKEGVYLEDQDTPATLSSHPPFPGGKRRRGRSFSQEPEEVYQQGGSYQGRATYRMILQSYLRLPPTPGSDATLLLAPESHQSRLHPAPHLPPLLPLPPPLPVTLLPRQAVPVLAPLLPPPAALPEDGGPPLTLQEGQVVLQIPQTQRSSEVVQGRVPSQELLCLPVKQTREIHWPSTHPNPSVHRCYTGEVSQSGATFPTSD